MTELIGVSLRRESELKDMVLFFILQTEMIGSGVG